MEKTSFPIDLGSQHMKKPT